MDAIDEVDEQLTLTVAGESVRHANVGSSAHTVVDFVESDVRPVVQLDIRQGERHGQFTRLDDEDVVVETVINDPNGEHKVDWSKSDANVIAAATIEDGVLRISSNAISAGSYVVEASVSDSEFVGENFSVRRVLHISVNEDRVDFDQDGIPNGFDTLLNANLMYMDRSSNENIVVAEQGAKIALGDVATYSSISGVTVLESQLDSAQFGSSVDSEYYVDGDYQFPLGLYDVEIQSLPVPGKPVQITFSNAEAIPQDAIYRIFVTY